MEYLRYLYQVQNSKINKLTMQIAHQKSFYLRSLCVLALHATLISLSSSVSVLSRNSMNLSIYAALLKIYFYSKRRNQ